MALRNMILVPVLITVFPDAATEYREREKLLDPCTPSGYSHSMKPGTLSPGSTAERSKYPSALQPRGNFSECRSAALMLLQKGKGKAESISCFGVALLVLWK